MDTRNELGKKMAEFLEENKIHTCFSLLRNNEDSSIDVMGSGRDIKDMMVKFFYGSREAEELLEGIVAIFDAAFKDPEFKNKLREYARDGRVYAVSKIIKIPKEKN